MINKFGIYLALIVVSMGLNPHDVNMRKCSCGTLNPTVKQRPVQWTKSILCE